MGKQLAQLSVWYQVGNISATHSSILAHEIPWTSEPGGLQSMGSQRVRYHWAQTHTHIGNNSQWGWWLLGQILCVLRIGRELRTGKHHHEGQIMAAYRLAPSAGIILPNKGLWHIGMRCPLLGCAVHSCEKKRNERQRRKGKIFPFECRVPKNSKEIRKPSSVINAKK